MWRIISTIVGDQGLQFTESSVYFEMSEASPGSAAEDWAITEQDKVELELTLQRFRQLVGELRTGVIIRNNFAPWEVEILQDFGTCRLDPRHKRGLLWQYQTAVEQQLAQGCATPMKVSEFLALRMRVSSPFLQ